MSFNSIINLKPKKHFNTSLPRHSLALSNFIFATLKSGMLKTV